MSSLLYCINKVHHFCLSRIKKIVYTVEPILYTITEQIQSLTKCRQYCIIKAEYTQLSILQLS